MAMNRPDPVHIESTKRHRVKVFMSPDNSIKPVVDFISSATTSLSMYIPELYSWTYDKNKPRPFSHWISEDNPLFQSISNVLSNTQNLTVRIVTNGPQNELSTGLCDMWQWLSIKNARVRYLPVAAGRIGGTLILVDEGECILLSTINSSPASFLYNRESSIILETKSSQVGKLFTETFDSDFDLSEPAKSMLHGRESVKLITSHVFNITPIKQPPAELVNSENKPFISNTIEADDVEFILAMAGPKSVQDELVSAIGTLSFCNIALTSLSNNAIANRILNTYKIATKVTLNLSYSVTSIEEAKKSDTNLLMLYTHGMKNNLFRGPLYNNDPLTKDFFTHNGQTYINSGKENGTLYFMTGSLSSDDLNENRNFYVGFKSIKLSKEMKKMTTNDQLKSTLWLPKDGTEVKQEKQYDML